MAKGGSTFRAGRWKGSIIGRVPDERERSPAKAVGAIRHAQAAPGIQCPSVSRESVRTTDAEPDGPDAPPAMAAGRCGTRTGTLSSQSTRRGRRDRPRVPKGTRRQARTTTPGVETWDLPTSTGTPGDDSEGQR